MIRRRLVLAAALELVLIALVVGMFYFAVTMVRHARDWREQGVGVGPSAQLAVDVSNWWLEYWWAAAPLIIIGGLGLAAVIVWSERRESPNSA